jgi:hypothetical protein
MLTMTKETFDQAFIQNMPKMLRYAKFRSRRLDPVELINNFYMYMVSRMELGEYLQFDSMSQFNTIFFSNYLTRLKHPTLPNITTDGKQSFKSVKHSLNESNFGGEIGIEDLSSKHQQLADTPESLLIAKQNAYILNEALFITNIDAPKGTKLAIDWANEELPKGSMYDDGIKSHYTNSKKLLANLIKREEIDFSVYAEDKYTLYGAHAKGANFTRKFCTVPGCKNKHKALGLCSHHYQLNRKAVANEKKSNTVSSNA